MQTINEFRDDPPCTTHPNILCVIRLRFGRRMYSYRACDDTAECYWKDELVYEKTLVMCRYNRNVIVTAIRYPSIRIVSGDTLAKSLNAASKDTSMVTPMAQYTQELDAKGALDAVCEMLRDRSVNLADVRDMAAVSTVHQVKGFEYDHCAVHSDLMSPGSDDERNISFVAFTRHKKSLAVMAEKAPMLRDRSIKLADVSGAGPSGEPDGLVAAAEEAVAKVKQSHTCMETNNFCEVYINKSSVARGSAVHTAVMVSYDDFDEGDSDLEHMLENSSKPASHIARVVCIVLVVFGLIVAFVVLFFFDHRFACNIIQYRSHCPPCNYAKEGICKFGEFCARIPGWREDYLQGCFSAADVRPHPDRKKHPDIACPHSMSWGTLSPTKPTPICEFDAKCQPIDQTALLPWRPQEWPDPDDNPTFYTTTIFDQTFVFSLLVRGPEQFEKTAFDNNQTASFNRVGYGKPTQDPSQLWPLCQTTSPQTPSPQTPSPQTPSPQTSSPQTSSPTDPAPNQYTQIFGSDWARNVEIPYRRMLIQPAQLDDASTSTPSLVFAAYNVFTKPPSTQVSDQFDQPPNLYSSLFSMHLSGHTFRFKKNTSDSKFQILSKTHPQVKICYEKGSERPYALTAYDTTEITQSSVACDFCWVALKNQHRALPGRSTEPQTFTQVLLAAPHPTALICKRGFADADHNQYDLVTWGFYYDYVNANKTDFGRNVCKQKNPTVPPNANAAYIYAVPTLTANDEDSQNQDTNDQGVLGHHYDVVGTDYFSQPSTALVCNYGDGCVTGRQTESRIGSFQGTCNFNAGNWRDCNYHLNFPVYCTHPLQQPPKQKL